MRLDKYLKLTRLIKRREVAKVLIDEGSILVNDKMVKPSYEVKIGDNITLTLGKRITIIKVKLILESVSKEESNKLYTILQNYLTTNH